MAGSSELEKIISCVNLNLRQRGVDAYFAQPTYILECFVIVYEPEAQPVFYVWPERKAAECLTAVKTRLPSTKNSQANQVSWLLEQMGYEIRNVKNFIPPDLENLAPERKSDDA